MNKRVILHCDCNSFFASVETALNPSLAAYPMAVCGSESDRHGIVLAKNELAKKYNIKTAETVYSARKKCPNLVICSPHYEEYVKYSKRVNEIYSKYTDMIEPFGIDESWLDVTASKKLFGTGEEIAEHIRREVKEKVGITVSIGVSFNKVFAKLGSDYKKPDAITVINEDNFRSIVFPLPVSSLLFVGHRTEMALLSMGIRTIGALAEANKDILSMRLGKIGVMLHSYANGIDNSTVEPLRDDAKSISNGFTFKHDLLGLEQVRIGIDYLSEEIGVRLRNSGLKCRTVSITIKDEFLHSIQRQRGIDPPTDIAREIADNAYSILKASWDSERPIRMITVAANNLEKNVPEQISLFSEEIDVSREKSKKREKAVDKIRQKYGNQSIVNGAIIGSDIGIFEKKKNDK